VILINQKERALINSESGDVVRPSCYLDLLGYHSYLLGRGLQEQAQQILLSVFEGELVITKMIEKAIIEHGVTS